MNSVTLGTNNQTMPLRKTKFFAYVNYFTYFLNNVGSHAKNQPLLGKNEKRPKMSVFARSPSIAKARSPKVKKQYRKIRGVDPIEFRNDVMASTLFS